MILLILNLMNDWSSIAGSTVEDKIKRYKRKLKTARTENFEIGILPKPENLQECKVDTYERVSTAFARAPDVAFDWIKATDRAVNLSELEDNDLPTLDAKLSLALRKIAHTDPAVQKEWNLHTTKFQKESKKIRARQMLFLLYAHLRPRVLGESLYELADLMNVRMAGDPTKAGTMVLEEFMFKWKKCLLNINTEVPEQTLHSLFLAQVKDHPGMRYDMDRYDRMDSKDRSYKWLYDCVESILERNRRDLNQSRIHRDMKGARPPSIPRPAGPATPRSASPSSRGRKSSRSPHRGKTSRSPSARSSRSPGGRRLCYEFAKTGKCKNGDKCKYSHNKKKRPGFRWCSITW